jgi:DNA-directed RNA polymerase specialized sigma subunit
VSNKLDFKAILSSAFTLPDDVRNYVIKLTKLREELIDENYNPEDVLLEYRKTGSDDLLLSLVLYNLPMAVILVKKYSGYIDPMQVSDMLSVALNTIVRCAQKYDASHGTKFSSYLVINMKGEILKYLDEAKPVKYTYYYYSQRGKHIDELDIDNIEPIHEQENLENSDLPQFITHHDIKNLLSENEPDDNMLENYVYEEGNISQNLDDYKESIHRALISEELMKCIDSISKRVTSEIESVILSSIKRSIIENVKYTVADLCERHNFSKRSAYSTHAQILKAIGDCLREKIRNNPSLEQAIMDSPLW